MIESTKIWGWANMMIDHDDKICFWTNICHLCYQSIKNIDHILRKLHFFEKWDL